MTAAEAKFSIGQLVQHRMFDYRGVIIDVDPQYQGSNEWYDMVARSRPPREKPWYHVLVDGSDGQTYVAERNLGPDNTGTSIQHPKIHLYFEDLSPKGYVARLKEN